VRIVVNTERIRIAWSCVEKLTQNGYKKSEPLSKDSLFCFPIRIHCLELKGSKYIVEKTGAAARQGLSAAIA